MMLRSSSGSFSVGSQTHSGLYRYNTANGSVTLRYRVIAP